MYSTSMIFINTDNANVSQRNIYNANANRQNRKLLLPQAEILYWR
ncbi:hypothetical protein CLV58_101131 [Spirosoma oryzae]|uniref:Uncharacterized protein n=1 Tax=Spirosoma oryzae TaxID=1469603 RepID=A0A2T0TN36_9BACT|nr:hypothetical protein [Spirosoma oryzae]PRY47067.1 hypothetical protein CLV58_101131 [Spirosoma oryzae]